MRIVILVAAVVVLNGCAHVAPTRSWSEVYRRLHAGAPVAVTTTRGAQTQGTVSAATNASLTLTVDGSSRQFRPEDIRELRRNGDRLWNGLLIGAGIGVAGATLPDNACHGPSGARVCNNSQNPQRILFATLVTLAGVAIDALHRDRSVLYVGPPSLPHGDASTQNRQSREALQPQATALSGSASLQAHRFQEGGKRHSGL